MKSNRKKKTRAGATPPAKLTPSEAGLAGWRLGVAALILAAAVMLLYLPSLKHGFLHWDDGDYVRNNPHVRQLSWQTVKWSFTQTHAANWHPLTWLSHALDAHLWGLDRPWGHHLSNVILHALNAAALLLVLSRLTRRFWVSLIAAALFAFHPLRVECVSWIAERKELLCTFFILLSLLAYAWYTARPSMKRYLLVFAALAAALMSKPMAVTMPLVLLLLDWWPLGRLRWTAVAEKGPLLALSAASCLITLNAQAGARMSLEVVGFTARISNAALSYAAYLGKMIWPAPGSLRPFYSFAGGLSPWTIFAVVLVLAGISALALRQHKRRPYLLLAWLWYLGMMVPVIGLVQVGSQRMADRYTYVPMIALVLALVLAAGDLAARRPMFRKVFVAAALLVVAALGWLTHQQQRVWADTITLWEYAAAGEPDSKVVRWHLLNARGRVFAESGEFDKAIEQFEAVLEIDPQNVEALNNLGLSLALAGRAGEAVKPLTFLLGLKPDDADVHCNLGSALLAQGRNLDDAVAHFRRATKLKPAMVQAYAGWARTEIARGYPERAVTQWKRVVQLMPWSVPERLQLARALHKAGRGEEAVVQLRKVLAIKPDLAAARRELEQILKAQGEPK